MVGTLLLLSTVGDFLRTIALSVAVLVTGCVDPKTIECGEVLCPSGYLCVDGECLLPGTLEVCEGSPDGTSCVVGVGDGVCIQEICVPITCGDGLVSGAEQCEPGDLQGATCESLSFYPGGAPTCSFGCTLDTSACGRCGDNIVNGPEECDGEAPADIICVDLGGRRIIKKCTALCSLGGADCQNIGWSLDPPVAGEEIEGIWGSADDDVFAVGLDTIVHWDGVRWETMTVPDELEGPRFMAVGGFARDDVYAATTGGDVAHYDGQSWRVVDHGLDDITWIGAAAASDNREFYMVGSEGYVAQYSQNTWRRVVIEGMTVQFHSVWAGDGLVVIGAPDGQVVMNDGNGWTTVSALPYGSVRDLWGSSAKDVYAATLGYGVAHWDGREWTPVDLPGEPRVWGISGTSPSNVVMFADVGYRTLDFAAIRYNGTSWVSSELPDSVRAAAVWARPGGGALIAGNDNGGARVLRGDGPMWAQTFPTPDSDIPQFNDAFGERADEVVAVGSIIRMVNRSPPGEMPVLVPTPFPYVTTFDGAQWQSLIMPDAEPSDLRSVKGLGAGSWIAVGDDGRVLYGDADGTVTTEWLAESPDLVHVWGTAGDDLYAISNAGQTYHRDVTGQWSPVGVALIDSYLTGAWGFDDGEAFGCAFDGTVYHRSVAGDWTTLDSGTGVYFTDAWGASPDNMFFTGHGGDIVRFDGSRFSSQAISASDLVSIRGVGADDVIVLPRAGPALHFDGSSWTTIRLQSSSGQSAVHVGTGFAVFGDLSGQVDVLVR
jgi:hypothetical protein